MQNFILHSNVNHGLDALGAVGQKRTVAPPDLNTVLVWYTNKLFEPCVDQNLLRAKFICSKLIIYTTQPLKKSR